RHSRGALDETEEALAWLRTAPGVSWGIPRRRAWSPPDGLDGARQSGLPHALAAHGASDTIVGAFEHLPPRHGRQGSKAWVVEGTPILFDPKCAWCWRVLPSSSCRARPSRSNATTGPYS